MDTQPITRWAPELLPKMTTQYSDISSDPDIEQNKPEKVKKQKKTRTNQKSTRYVSSSSEASSNRSQAKTSESAPKQGDSNAREQEKSRQPTCTIVYKM